MTRLRSSSGQRKHRPELFAGLAVVILLLALIGWHVGIVMGLDGSVVVGVDWNASVVLLAGAIIAMAVFNMAFFRHLSRAHAADKRRAAARRALRSPRDRRT